jgi:uncharacterized protein (DUF305 family)
VKHYAKLGLLALLLAAALILVSCGGAGGGIQGMDHGENAQKSGGDMQGMEHGPGNMASGMVMENGRYSDKAFIDAMVPHHQGAIAMAEVALKNAEHEEIKQLSKNIISTQQAEIKDLESIKKVEFGTSQVPMEMSPQQMQTMGVMMNPQKLANREPFDRAFMDAMIPHHQSAIEMAQVALENSDNPEIKELAQNIVSAQQTEIEQMRQWREEWYPEG